MNKSSFTLRLINQVSSYTIQLFDFFNTSTLLVRIKFLMKLVLDMTVAYALTVTVNLKRIKLSISKTSLIYSNLVDVNLHRIKLVATSKAIGKMTATIKNRMNIVAITKAIGKMVTSLNLHTIKLILSMDLGEFTQLLVHDPELLEDVDPLTLEDLDFTTI